MQAWSVEKTVKPIEPIELAPSSLSTKMQAWPMENKVRPIQPIELAPPPYEERKKLDMENSCENCCWNAFQSKTFLLGLLELLLITIFVFVSIQNPTMLLGNNGVYPGILSPAVKSGFCAASVIMGVSLCATFWHKKKFLFTTYLYFGAIRIWFCLLSVHYYRESLYLWNTRMTLFGLAVFFVGSWIIVFNKRQKSEWVDEHVAPPPLNVAPPPYEEKGSQNSSRCSGHTARILASLFGVIEIVFGMFFLWSVYIGIKQIIPLNSFLCTPLWVAMIAFGALLPLNFIFKSKKIYGGYLGYSTIRLLIGIIFGIFLIMSLTYARARIQEINYEMAKIDEFLNTQGNFQGQHGNFHGRHKRENHDRHMGHRNGNWKQQNSQQYQKAQDKKALLELELHGDSRIDFLGLIGITRSYPSVLIVLTCLCLISLVANMTVFTAFRKLK
uniref:Transmembrane protein n=1 Tax=Acrobeloides nanus TaxID=290746 RepID=A0A914EPH1_9BILA